MSNSDGYFGVQQPEDGGDDYNSIAFIVRQIVNGRNFSALVQVIRVTAPGGLALAGTVDVQPLVNQLDGQGNAVPHGTVNDIPYIRIQGGTNGIIIDPQPGDIGVCIFCDRDNSSVLSSRGPANPGSLRRSDMADGVYIGGMLNGIPSQYMMFTASGIDIVSPNLIHMNAPQIHLECQTFAMEASGSATIQSPQVQLTCSTLGVSASSSATINTPLFTVNGVSNLNGNMSVSGTSHFGSGGGGSGVQIDGGGNITAAGTVTAPNVVGTSDVTANGISGSSHHHTGVKGGSDTSGGPI